MSTFKEHIVYYTISKLMIKILLQSELNVLLFLVKCVQCALLQVKGKSVLHLDPMSGIAHTDLVYFEEDLYGENDKASTCIFGTTLLSSSILTKKN